MASDEPEIDWGNERLSRAQRAVEANVYDVDSWSLLVREAQTRSINDVRTMYEKLITAFPTTGRYWKIYIEQEMKARNFEKVEKIGLLCSDMLEIIFFGELGFSNLHFASLYILFIYLTGDIYVK